MSVNLVGIGNKVCNVSCRGNSRLIALSTNVQDGYSLMKNSKNINNSHEVLQNFLLNYSTILKLRRTSGSINSMNLPTNSVN